MAFAITNPMQSPVGNKSSLVGSWTGNQGDAPGTLTLSGGFVWQAEFMPAQASGVSPTGGNPSWSFTTASNQITLTINNHEDVTAGRFFILYA